MLNQDEHRALSALLLFVLLFMVSTAFAAGGSEAAAVAQSGDSAGSVKQLLGQSARQLQGEPAAATVVPVVAILAVFGGPVVVVLGIGLAFFAYQYRRRQLMHQTLNQMVEKGVDIPPHIASVFAEPKPDRDAPMRRGLLLSGLGIGLIIFFFTIDVAIAAGVGAIPLSVGLAYLLIWHLEKKASYTAHEAGRGDR